MYQYQFENVDGYQLNFKLIILLKFLSLLLLYLIFLYQFCLNAYNLKLFFFNL